MADEEPLTERELEKLQEFKELVVSNGLREKIRDVDFNDRYCIRWLRARKFDPSKAVEMLRLHLEWREEKGIEKYNLAAVGACLDTDAVRIIGEDKNGRPTFVIRPAKHTPGSLPIDQVEALMVLTLEVSIRCLKDGTDDFIILFDYENWGLRNVDKGVDNLIMGVGQANYPERLKEALLVEPPWYFSTVWTVIKIFLDEKTRNKMNFISRNANEELAKRYEPQNLLEKFGGEHKGQTVREFLTERLKDENETLGEYIDRVLAEKQLKNES